MELNTFAKFINCYNIEIPIIQRDYVYGREKSRDTGADLVKDMINSIKNHEVLDLNFIYGIETGLNDEKPYYFPIDGQQRLTTLFLLYWYISIKSGNKDKFFELHPDFSYKTRSSAKEFFMWISDSNNVDLFELVSDSTKNIAKGIRDMSGFKASWNYDNTVQSCIYILNQIAEILKNDDRINDYYTSINDPNECCLKFTVIKEENAMVENGTADVGNKDSINEAKAKANRTYIRMNARGKQLTDFEKIKSIVDSLEEENKANSDKFSYKYDTEYINLMYDNVKNMISGSSSIDRLKAITDSIDRKSHVFFINMFKVLCKSEGISVDIGANEKSSDKYIRELKRLNSNKESAKKYIDFMNYYMKFLLENNKYGSEAFQNIGMKNDFDNIFSEVLYIYYFAKNHAQELPSDDNIVIFRLVLKNLSYSTWYDKYKIVEEFIKEIAVKDNVIQYLCDAGQCNEYVKKCGLNDINVRWKEQVLLAKCCTNFSNNIASTYSAFSDYRKFEDYRGLGYDKLQFVMHVADIWDKLSPAPSEFEFFINCLEQYSTYRKNELLWRQNYAISAYTDINNSDAKLKDDDSVNSISMGDGHRWHNKWYVWDDEYESNKTYMSSLSIAKKVYFIGMAGFNKLKNELIYKDPIKQNVKTWLGYALIWSDKMKECNKDSVGVELFSCRLTNENNALGSVFFERRESDKKPFMMHILKISRLEKGKGEFQYGFRDCSKEILAKTYPVHLEQSPYNKYINNNSSFYSFRTCNININVREEVKERLFERLPLKSELCLHCYEEKELYCIYEYQPDTPNEFKKYEYNMESYVSDCDANRNKWKQFDLTVDDRLQAYKKCGGWSSEVIDDQLINTSNTCSLWKTSEFIRERSTYAHTIYYTNDIKLNNDISVELI